MKSSWCIEAGDCKFKQCCYTDSWSSRTLIDRSHFFLYIFLSCQGCQARDEMIAAFHEIAMVSNLYFYFLYPKITSYFDVSSYFWVIPKNMKSPQIPKKKDRESRMVMYMEGAARLNPPSDSNPDIWGGLYHDLLSTAYRRGAG